MTLIIAHRGASGYRLRTSPSGRLVAHPCPPEHTLEAYELAITIGADYIEPDLVITADGVLIARHENALAIIDPTTHKLIEATTNIIDLPQFANRMTTKIIDGKEITGWFTEDFTFQEIRMFIRARERIPHIRPQNTIYNDRFFIPTLEEMIELAQQKSLEMGRTIGIYPETKHPSYFNSLGLSMEEPLVQILLTYNYTEKKDPVFIQSFEVSNLQKLRNLTNVSLIQLIDERGKPFDRENLTYTEMITHDGLTQIATYAQGIGISKNLIIPRDSNDNLLEPTNLVNNAHASGLKVHAYTFRNENIFLPKCCQDHPQKEYHYFYQTGIDGLFSDYPNTAFQVRSDT